MTVQETNITKLISAKVKKKKKKKKKAEDDKRTWRLGKNKVH